MEREGGGDSGVSSGGGDNLGYCATVQGCGRCVPLGRLAYVAAVQAQTCCVLGSVKRMRKHVFMNMKMDVGSVKRWGFEPRGWGEWGASLCGSAPCHFCAVLTVSRARPAPRARSPQRDPASGTTVDRAGRVARGRVAEPEARKRGAQCAPVCLPIPPHNDQRINEMVTNPDKRRAVTGMETGLRPQRAACTHQTARETRCARRETGSPQVHRVPARSSSASNTSGGVGVRS